MKTFTRSLMLGGALAFAVPAISLAEPPGLSEGERILEQHLQPGKTPADYRQILTDMGYTTPRPIMTPRIMSSMRL